MAVYSLTLREFLEACRREGFFEEQRRTGIKSVANYTSFSGANPVVRHDGRFIVPREKQERFLQLCAGAIKGQANISIHMAIDPPVPPNVDRLSPLFFDLDWKPFADQDRLVLSTVARQFYSLLKESKLCENEEWCRAVMFYSEEDPHKSVYPDKLRERFPGLQAVDDILDKFQSNVDELSGTSSSENIFSDSSLRTLFATDYKCFNWLNMVIGSALGVLCQRQVKQYYRLANQDDEMFNCAVFVNRTVHGATECKIGVHLHFDVILTPQHAMDIATGFQKELNTNHEGLGFIIDMAVHRNGIRMPFTLKPKYPHKKGTKRVCLDDGSVEMDRRWYHPVAYLASGTNSYDGTSPVAKAFYKNVLVALNIASIRTMATTPSPYFDNTDLPQAPHIPNNMSVEDVETTLATYVTESKLSTIKKQVRLVAGSTDDKLYYDLLRQYAVAISSIDSTNQRGSSIVPAASPEGQEIARIMPPLMKELFNVDKFNAFNTRAILYHPGTKSTKPTTLRVYTDSSWCMNRAPPDSKENEAGKHSSGFDYLRFLLMKSLTGSWSVTQLCSNPSQGHGRKFSDKKPCTQWPGCRVEIDTKYKFQTPKREEITAQLDQLVALASSFKLPL